MLPLTIQTSPEIARELARRVKARRLERTWTQKELADRAGISLETYRVFERTGRISLERFLSLAIVLNATTALEGLFAAPLAWSLDELERRQRGPGRKRGKRSDATS